MIDEGAAQQGGAGSNASRQIPSQEIDQLKGGLLTPYPLKPKCSLCRRLKSVA